MPVSQAPPSADHRSAPADGGVEHLDVLVVGAGLSGIGLARTLAHRRHGTRFAVLEARAAVGGTWDLFRFPGIRSDSDLHTFGYDFKPWRHRDAIADGPAIRDYLTETVRENGLEDRIRLGHRVVGASWSSDDARWTVEVERVGTGAGAGADGPRERFRLTASWLFSAAGYYRYDRGHTPELPGLADFAGPVVHPQAWPEDLDVGGRRVVVIGSGATMVTLAPVLAETAAGVTVLQRTPSYVLPVARTDAVTPLARRLLGDRRARAAVRRVNIAWQLGVWRFCRRHPQAARRAIRWVNARQLPPGYPVDVHFHPPYDPWDQRLCIAADGDLFRSIRDGAVEMVTDRIARITPTGVRLVSGRELAADVLVTATGLEVQPFGGFPLVVDGRPVELAEALAYKGFMLSGVPNFGYAVGYTNASWTLKVGLVCEHFCRLLDHLETFGYDVACPRPAEPAPQTRPLLDFGAGYVRRVADRLPQQGDRAPWQVTMDYGADVRALRDGPVADPELRLSRSDRAPGGSEGDGGDRDSGGDSSGDRFVDLPAGPRLCHRVDGPPDGEPVVLVAGLSLDLTSWPAALVAGLQDAGYQVVRLDNRDAGRSERIDRPPPGTLRQLLARPRPDAYDLADMAADVHGLLDHLGLDRVHLLGMSMGAMITQVLAARHPARVRTLTSVFSSTGHRRVGQPARSTVRRLLLPPARDVDERVARHLDMLAHIGSRQLPPDLEHERRWVAAAWARAGGRPDPDGVARQIGAIQASGDRTAELARITAPTLVVHGSVDRMVHPSGGRATADAIPGARHVEIAGMHHHLSPGAVDRLLPLVLEHLRRAGAGADPVVPVAVPA